MAHSQSVASPFATALVLLTIGTMRDHDLATPMLSLVPYLFFERPPPNFRFKNAAQRAPSNTMRQHQSTSSALAFATTTYTQCDWLPDALATGSNVADWTLRLDEASCVVRREASVCQRKWPSASALSICCSTQQLRFRCGSRKRNSRHETLIKAGRSASRLVLPVERTRSGGSLTDSVSR